MKGKNDGMSARQPWYSPDTSDKGKLSVKFEQAVGALSGEDDGLFSSLMRVANGLTAVGLGATAGVFATVSVFGDASSAPITIAVAVISAIMSLFFLFRQMGTTAKKVSMDHKGISPFQLGVQVAKGETTHRESRRFAPAPELALHQFVNQVKAYSAEKSYQRTRAQKGPEQRSKAAPEPVDLLKRRWNDVLDSLNEFEIYLAGDPQGMIDKLLARYPSTQMDVSQIFRDVAESFDTAWRRKGINIESAIVTPLKATTSEPILRRILVGPWRACAYFAKRGKGVVFSAQSQDTDVVARWECEGLTVADEYFEVARNSDLGVNERIEMGMEMLAGDTQSSGTLFALISLITWIDLAKATHTEFEFKNTNEGFVIELRLR